MRNKTLQGVALAVAVTLGVTACVTDEFGNKRKMTNAEKGALLGAAGGAATGALIGKKNRGKGALIGAVGGGLAGAGVGAYMDSQKKDFEKALAPEQQSGAVVIEKLPQDMLKVTMTSQTAFDVNSAALKPGFQPSLDKISDILNRYGKTQVLVVGHTDNVGSDQANQALSEQRAKSVHDYMMAKHVVEQRVDYIGKGESDPHASNTTAEGRQQNRRVEVLIKPVVAE